MTVTIMNDRDVLLQASTRDVDPRANKYINLSVTTPIFHIGTNGVSVPSIITITALPINIGGGLMAFSVSAGTLDGTGNSRTLSFGNMPTDSVTVTATITDEGQTYVATQIISKVQDGAQGAPGTGSSPPMYATAILYKWSSVNPGLPSGTSTLTWASGVNTSYIGSDGWYTTVQANPGTSGVQLWTAMKPVSAASGTTTTDVTYAAGANLAAISQNGTQGSDGAQGVPGVPGIKYVAVHAYQWATGPAPTATGSTTWTWASASYTAPPTGWSVTKPDAPALGYTLYEATVSLVDASGAATTAIDWTTASRVGISYIGLNGSTGPTGSASKIAFTLVDGNSLAGTPPTHVRSGNNLPSTGTWGETRAWVATPPAYAAGQSIFQSNGIFDGTNTTWSLPYLSALRVGQLSAIAADLGAITAGSMNIGGNVFTVDTGGNVNAKSITIRAADGTVILASGVALNPNYAAAGTLNNAITLGANGVLSGAGGGSVTIAGLGYTGALNATYGATFGSNISGQITAANVNSYVGLNAINSTYISDLAANKLTAGTLAAGVVYAGTINANQMNAGTLNAGVVYAGAIGVNQIQAGTLAAGVVYAGAVQASQVSAGSLSAITATIGTLRTAASGARTEISDNIIKVFDTSGVVRVKLGNLSL